MKPASFALEVYHSRERGSYILCILFRLQRGVVVAYYGLSEQFDYFFVFVYKQYMYL
jgi:hypothetical protein